MFLQSNAKPKTSHLAKGTTCIKVGHQESSSFKEPAKSALRNFSQAICLDVVLETTMGFCHLEPGKWKMRLEPFEPWMKIRPRRPTYTFSGSSSHFSKSSYPAFLRLATFTETDVHFDLGAPVTMEALLLCDTSVFGCFSGGAVEALAPPCPLGALECFPMESAGV